jgi:hypothetical protein
MTRTTCCPTIFDSEREKFEGISCRLESIVISRCSTQIEIRSDWRHLEYSSGSIVRRQMKSRDIRRVRGIERDLFKLFTWRSSCEMPMERRVSTFDEQQKSTAKMRLARAIVVQQTISD